MYFELISVSKKIFIIASKERSTAGRQRGENKTIALSLPNLSQIPGLLEGRGDTAAVGNNKRLGNLSAFPLIHLPICARHIAVEADSLVSRLSILHSNCLNSISQLTSCHQRDLGEWFGPRAARLLGDQTFSQVRQAAEQRLRREADFD